MQCNQCWQYQNPVLDVIKDQKGNIDYANSKVLCTECDKHMDHVTHFTKVSMHGLGQIKRSTGTKKAFAIECNKCQKKDQPLLINKKAVCKHCKGVHEQISGPYLQTLIEFLK